MISWLYRRFWEPSFLEVEERALDRYLTCFYKSPTYLNMYREEFIKRKKAEILARRLDDYLFAALMVLIGFFTTGWVIRWLAG